MRNRGRDQSASGMGAGIQGLEPAACEAFGTCGACQLLDVPYPKQLHAKQQRIASLFPAAADAHLIEPILGMEHPFHYRNKVIAPYAPRKAPAEGARGAKAQSRASAAGKRAHQGGFARGKRHEGSCRGRGSVLTGMYAQGTHRIVPTSQCLLENEVAKAATLAVRDIMEERSIPAYEEDTGRGFIRHVVARAGRSGELLVTVVTNGNAFEGSKPFCRELKERVPATTTVIQNVNRRNTNVILGEEERTLYGPGFILDDLCGLRFRISSSSFYQVNALQAEVLYERAVEMAEAGFGSTVVDAYCGTGTIGLVAALRGAGRVIGVESVASAVSDARLNARHNGIGNAEFVCADAGGFLQDLASSTQGFDNGVLMMDPPRAGATLQFLEAACALRPERIVYISCNPETQARDVAYMTANGYRITSVQPVDMFPHTNHIENILRLDLTA